MFSSALKSFSSNITSNYSLAANPTTVTGPWKIFDGKKKSTGKAVSIFVFDRKCLEPNSGGLDRGGRSGAASVRKAQDEVVERLKKEASSLARLRHPSILELAEPVEDTRSGGLMFATEPVTASLSSILEEKDEQERTGGVGGRSSRYVVEDPEGGRRRREVEIDELEIQKGLLQIAKGLEFLHESAKLVHANLTPDAIFVNIKGDWKISGLGFSTPLEGSSNPSVAPIFLSEVLNHDARLPRFVQLNIDYTSPDFVLDNSTATAADMFSLGLIILALYNSPHHSPLETNSSISSYKRAFSSPSTTPTANNNFLVKQTLPREMLSGLLPRLITRRPAQRFNAQEFQQAQYFDNILVSTIRFLDSLPAKSPNEKSQFLRGLPRILTQFPKSVLEKKVLPALLEETKDPELLSLILSNTFKILELVPNSKRTFSEKAIPCLRQVFLPPAKKSRSKESAPERDTATEGGLVVLLENMSVVANNCTGKEFKDDILPILFLALESPTHSIQDASLQCLNVVLPVLDFSTIKNDLFPIIAAVFSKTSSMAIKIRGLEALNILCGGEMEQTSRDDGGLDGFSEPQRKQTSSSSAVLDKFTVQEKVVPLLRAIKTKEPAVMMAALNVFTQVGKVADAEFLALEVLPSLWSFSLGPLLHLEQFQAFMSLIKGLSTKIEESQIRKLKELSATGGTTSRSAVGASARGGRNLNGTHASSSGGEDGDFESLVTGRKANAGHDFFDSGWAASDSAPTSKSSYTPNQQQTTSPAPTFSWSSTPMNAAPTQPSRSNSTGLGMLSTQQHSSNSRSITPDQNLSSFAALTPSNALGGPAPGYFPQQQQQPAMQPLQTQTSGFSNGSMPMRPAMNSMGSSNSINWSPAASSSNNTWSQQSQQRHMATASSPLGFNSNSNNNSNTMGSTGLSNFRIAPPPGHNQTSGGTQSMSSSSSFMSLSMTTNNNNSSSNNNTMGGIAGMGGLGHQNKPSIGLGMAQTQNNQNAGQKQGLDKYESLL